MNLLQTVVAQAAFAGMAMLRRYRISDRSFAVLLSMLASFMGALAKYS